MLATTLFLLEHHDAGSYSRGGSQQKADPKPRIAVVAGDRHLAPSVRKLRDRCAVGSDLAYVAARIYSVSRVSTFRYGIARPGRQAADGDGLTVLELHCAAAADRSGLAARVAVAAFRTELDREAEILLSVAQIAGDGLADRQAAGFDNRRRFGSGLWSGFRSRLWRGLRCRSRSRSRLRILRIRERRGYSGICGNRSRIAGLRDLVAFIVALGNHIACPFGQTGNGNGFAVLEFNGSAAGNGARAAARVLKAAFRSERYSKGECFIRIAVCPRNRLADGQAAGLRRYRRIVRLLGRGAVLRVRESRFCGLTISDSTGIAGLGNFVTVVVALRNYVTDPGRQARSGRALAALEREGSNTVLKGHIAVCTAYRSIGKGHGEGKRLCRVSRVAADRLADSQIAGLGRDRLKLGPIDDRSGAVDAGEGAVLIQDRGAGVLINPLPTGKGPAVVSRVSRRGRIRASAICHRKQLILQFSIVPFVAILEDDAHAPAGGQVCPDRILTEGQCVAADDTGFTLIIGVDWRVACCKCRNGNVQQHDTDQQYSDGHSVLPHTLPLRYRCYLPTGATE